ncbi:ATP-binding cassette domain-containing protein [Desulfosporosinus youngiae]|uniref:ABC-type spermidine/putrescine transport system, ATPase component n=1 Tax=Desulfosporosinus youngiae DSM 17734 TaxID=768710 RepID=H5XV84_9FIRM|nr:ATP-binding cassette domain-containing protein [Desulfosporosinus youngiae]EHQ89682.1 ABC-type spermidine/putrescine transport system, ATPase component [Desulfosporosinus youngiae DSM 17734]
MLKAHFKKKLPSFELEADITLKSGILALVGPSGAGKTTILQCIAGLQTPSWGEININDKIIFSSEHRADIPIRKRRIGYVFQDYALFPHMSVEKNVMYGKPQKGSIPNKVLAVSNVLEMLKIAHLRNRYPNQISGGEKQRVALARALMTEPELLLLDEPLSALDQDTRSTLQQELLKLQTQWQIPFILVTHDAREAEMLGSQIIKLDKGKQEEIKKL